ncbi:hypothetical protein TPAR_00029 [Tolypocladium paradoxum]|uniref:Uncharacterized protein n=1 Tax=Tolypocladium paradoxum TaxID=94208 RepID=A0A2S4LBI3_9HYPO|nr:hypothetical protein TPAR_00029 [Tolypocladium paradoxum]
MGCWCSEGLERGHGARYLTSANRDGQPENNEYLNNNHHRDRDPTEFCPRLFHFAAAARTARNAHLSSAAIPRWHLSEAGHLHPASRPSPPSYRPSSSLPMFADAIMRI